MTDTSATDRSPDPDGRPPFAPPSQPGSPSQPAPSPYAAAPHVVAPDAAVEAALPRERVGRGAALALLAVPAGAIVSGVVWKLGFVASISGIVLAALAALLYVRGSGGRVQKGVPVIAAIIVVGIVVSFFTAVAVDLWGYYPELDAEMASVYGSRWAFVTDNLFYPTLLEEYTKDAVLFASFGLLGGSIAILRLVRASRRT